MYRSRCAVEMDRVSAKLSKLPSAVSSPGSRGFTSMSSANRSRIALLYSARFSRCTAPIRPGFRSEVVEATVRSVIARQQRLHVHVQREQIANRVVVLRAIQPLHRADSAWIQI